MYYYPLTVAFAFVTYEQTDLATPHPYEPQKGMYLEKR